MSSRLKRAIESHAERVDALLGEEAEGGLVDMDQGRLFLVGTDLDAVEVRAVAVHNAQHWIEYGRARRMPLIELVAGAWSQGLLTGVLHEQQEDDSE